MVYRAVAIVKIPQLLVEVPCEGQIFSSIVRTVSSTAALLFLENNKTRKIEEIDDLELVYIISKASHASESSLRGRPK